MQSNAHSGYNSKHCTPHAPSPSLPLLQVQSDNIASFLGAAVLSNKPRLLIISPKPHPQLHHLLVAMKYRHLIAFGFVSTAKGRNAAVAQHLGILGEEEAGIVFKESSQNVAGRSSVIVHATTHMHIYAPFTRLRTDGVCVYMCVCVCVCVCVS